MTLELISFTEQYFFGPNEKYISIGVYSAQPKHASLNYSSEQFWRHVYSKGVKIDQGKEDSAEAAKTAVIKAYYRYVETLKNKEQ